MQAGKQTGVPLQTVIPRLAARWRQGLLPIEIGERRDGGRRGINYGSRPEQEARDQSGAGWGTAAQALPSRYRAGSPVRWQVGQRVERAQQLVAGGEGGQGDRQFPHEDRQRSGGHVRLMGATPPARGQL